MRHKDTHIQRRGIKIVERIDPGVRRILTQNQNDGSVKGRRRDSSDLFQRRLTAKRINLKRLDIFGRRSPSARLDNRVVRFFFYRSVLKLADGKTFFCQCKKVHCNITSDSTAVEMVNSHLLTQTHKNKLTMPEKSLTFLFHQRR